MMTPSNIILRVAKADDIGGITFVDRHFLLRKDPRGFFYYDEVPRLQYLEETNRPSISGPVPVTEIETIKHAIAEGGQIDITQKIPAGAIVTCENGHRLLRVKTGIIAGARIRASDFESINPEFPDPSVYQPFLRCPHCKGAYIRTASGFRHQIHIENEGWKP